MESVKTAPNVFRAGGWRGRMTTAELDPRRRPSPTLERVAFKTDRLGEFVGRRELTAQIGHPPEQWALVLLKEAVDNSLDACEETPAAPELRIDVSTDPGAITVTDKGPGVGRYIDP